jgi:peroxiredoxin
MEKPNRDRGLRGRFTSKTQKAAIVVALVLLVGGGVYWFSRTRIPETSDSPAVGRGNFKAAPRFELKDASGKTHRLTDFKGKAIVLHFWASWCPPCLEELTDWLKFASQFDSEKSKVQFLAISLDESWNDAHKILPESGVPAGVISLLDLSKEVPEKYGSYQYPETYLLGPDLTIITKWVGPQTWENPSLRNIIERVAAQK